MRLKCAITMVALLTMLAFAAVAQAQINSNAATMAIHATYEGYVGLTVSPASVSIDLPDGPVATFTVNLDASTSYGNVTVYAYVQSATALWNGANEIPANHVYVGEVGGGDYDTPSSYNTILQLRSHAASDELRFRHSQF